MISRQRIQKTVIYKRAQFSLGGKIVRDGPKLQELIEQAQDKITHVDEWEWSPSTDSDVRRLINTRVRRRGVLCFQLIQFEKGRDQILITINQNLKEYPVNPESIPPTDEGLPREIMETSLYAAVYGNHIVLAQSQSLKSESLEAYLVWLLCDKLKILNSDIALDFLDEPTAAARKAMKKHKVKAIRMGSGVNLSPSAGPKARPSADVVTERITPDSLGNRIIEDLIGRENFAHFLEHNHITHPENIRVSVEITYVRKTNDEGEVLLDALAQAGRHSEDSPFTILMSDGSEVKGEELKIKGQVTVNALNKVIETGNMFEELSKWLLNHVSTTIID